MYEVLEVTLRGRGRRLGVSGKCVQGRPRANCQFCDKMGRCCILMDRFRTKEVIDAVYYNLGDES
jgi:hypothetical protein